ncbi:MAG: histidinol dehydrogenase [Deltaproteobacteria bacterium]|nr:histidinol dehydrogenase [Deltaproteobacteria bacterium]
MAGLQIEYLKKLDPARRQAIMSRSREDVSEVLAVVAPILAALRRDGDAESLRQHAQFKADLRVEDLEATPQEIEAAYRAVDPQVLAALKVAAGNIEKFHQAQREREMWAMEVQPGILAGRLTRSLDRVGCYIPGGLASYPSSALMNIIPAKVAGVKEIVAATPPGPEMAVNPATLVAAHLAGAQRLFKIGGPWAIGSMAYGTKLVPRVDKIVGPGNKYVTAAKLLVFGQVDIDSPAGPSEALILADETAKPRLLAIDFLSQVEHDPEAAAVLVTPSPALAQEVVDLILSELPRLPRREIISAALGRYSAVLVVETLDEAVEFANLYAAEHLQIVTREPFAILPHIRHAGSIFLGPFAPVPVGDYASGTNHVLPTGGCARMFSGLSVDAFIKKPTFQHLSQEALAALKDTVITLAESEGLLIHARAIAERFRFP